MREIARELYQLIYNIPLKSAQLGKLLNQPGLRAH